MLYAVLFEDDEAHADMRPKHLPAHLEFLERHAADVRAAGPLRDTASDSPAGGLWLVEADSADHVWQLVRADPFWPTGIRKSVRVLAWKRVFADGERLLPVARG